MTTLDLSGRTALVSGGAQGLGEGMARALAAAGAHVVIADLKDQLGSEVAADIGGTFVHLDVTDDAGWERATAAAVQATGRLDVLVNNAGVEISGLVTDLDPGQVSTMLQVNVLGTALGTKHALRTMRPGGAAGHGGVVINVASVAADIAFPAISIYSATKAGVDRFTRVAAMESAKLGYGVRVNCIHPGLVPTEMGQGLAVASAQLGLHESPDAAVADVIGLTPSGRLGTVEDMANAVVFLASDQAEFINGVGLQVDGGMGM